MQKHGSQDEELHETLRGLIQVANQSQKCLSTTTHNSSSSFQLCSNKRHLNSVPVGQVAGSFPLTSLFRRLLLFRGLWWVIIVTAVSEPYGTVVPILCQSFTQSFVFFLLNKNESFINKNGRLLRKTSYTSKVQLSVKHKTLFFQSLFEENFFSGNAHLVSIVMHFCQYVFTHRPQNTRLLWKNSSCWGNFGIKNCIKDN